MVICFPDVCQTPTPAGPVPIPYPNTAQSANIAKGSKKVKIEGQMCAFIESEYSMSNGDQAGSAGGVVSGKIMGKAVFKMGSPSVKIEGKPVCRMGDLMIQNENNAM